jgi:hypothetical protein
MMFILTLGRPKWVIRDPMSQHINKFMRLNADNSFMLRVFLNCVYLFIKQHINNILIVYFQKNYENLCPGRERPSFGLLCGYSIYMAKAVLEYFVRRVVTNSLGSSMYQLSETLKTPKTPSVSAILTTNRGNAMIMWRDCNWYFFLFLLSVFHICFKVC